MTKIVVVIVVTTIDSYVTMGLILLRRTTSAIANKK